MRHFLLLLIFCSFSILLSAQTFTVHGNVTNVDGSPVDGAFMEFNGINSNGNIFVTTNTFTTADGSYSKDVNIAQADSSSYIEVSLDNCDSTWVTQVVNFTLNGSSPLTDFIYCAESYCEVEVIVDDSSGAPLPYLIAENTAGNSPFTYVWSNGETTGGISPTSSGTYCVTTTDVGGCEAFSCGEVVLNPPVDSCTAIINLSNGPAGAALVASGFSDGNAAAVAFEWDTGANSSVLTVFNPATYCVTVTFSDGCLSTSCFNYDPNPGGGADSLCHVDVAEFTTASGEIGLQIISQSGLEPYSYVWSNGQIGEEIIVNNTQTHCVTMTDAVGCEAVDCQFVTAPTCSVNILQDSIVGTLEAVWSTNDSPNFEWTYEGVAIANTSSIDIVGDGIYCVTATSPNGCTATDCHTFHSNPIDTSCFVGIFEEVGAGDVNLLVANPSGGIPPYVFEWNTGAITESVLAVLGETFCVTVTDANECMSTDCFNVSSQSSFQGTVRMDSIAGGFNSGVVYLIQFDAVDSTLTAIDSTVFNGSTVGLFNFTSLQPGEYLVKAALDESSSGYETTLPTYHVDHLFWHEADLITIPYSSSSPKDFDIPMVIGSNPGGPGFIGGFVTEGANRPGYNVVSFAPGDPLSNVSVLLLDDNDNPITHTVTNTQGRYEFDDIPFGTYKVYVEVTGKDQGLQTVTIDGNNPEINNTDFNVNSTYSITAVEEIVEVKSLTLFPNPLYDNNLLNLKIDMTTHEALTIEVINVSGSRLFSRQESVTSGVNNIQLDMTDLNTGVYFLNVSSSNGVMTRKFIR